MVWNISKAATQQNLNVAARENTLTGLFFKPDGTKLYFTGESSIKIIEYNLVSPWNISTGVYLQEFDISSVDIIPRDIFFKADGSKMYMIGGQFRSIMEYDLGTPWDISTLSFLRKFGLISDDFGPQGLFLKPDGTKFYMTGTAFKAVFEYDLSTPWDVSTTAKLQVIPVSAQDNEPYGLFFDTNATKMYVVGDVTDKVFQYDLGTIWDISTISYSQEVSIANEETTPTAMYIKPDGSTMYIVGEDSDSINEYSLVNSKSRPMRSS